MMRYFISYCWKRTKSIDNSIHFGCTTTEGEHPIDMIKSFEKTCPDCDYVLLNWIELEHSHSMIDREI